MRCWPKYIAGQRQLEKKNVSTGGCRVFTLTGAKEHDWPTEGVWGIYHYDIPAPGWVSWVVAKAIRQGECEVLSLCASESDSRVGIDESAG